MQLAEVPKYGIDAALCTACRKNITSQVGLLHTTCGQSFMQRTGVGIL